MEYVNLQRSGSDIKRDIMDARELPTAAINQKFHSSKFEHYKVKNVLIYSKPYDSEVIKSFVKLYDYITESKNGLQVHVEQWVIKEIAELGLELTKEPLIFENKDEKSRSEIDYIITLGGDGTILWASKQFHGDYIPPIVGFAHGSLGYLCQFEMDEFKSVVDKYMCHDCKVHLDNRLRLKCGVKGKPERQVYRGNNMKVPEFMLVKDFHIINEIVIDRGPSPYAI